MRTAQEQVATLAAELAEYQANQAELNARLVAVGQRIQAYASTLNLEHSEGTVLLDLVQLTVLASTNEGTVPLSRIGSARNWVGYHIATRWPSTSSSSPATGPCRGSYLGPADPGSLPRRRRQRRGQPVDDADRIAVRAMFRLMYDFVVEAAPNFQIIVCDHADLPEDWFQDSVRQRWREGRGR